MRKASKKSDLRRIREIKVRGLFGIFDHDIPLQQKARITILHGLNGFGKTVILKLLYDLSREDFEAIYPIPFDTVEILLEDKAGIRLLRSQNSMSIHWTHDGWKTSTQSLAYPDLEEEDLDRTKKQFGDLMPYNLAESGTVGLMMPSIGFVGVERLFKSVRKAVIQKDKPGRFVVEYHSLQLAELIRKKLAEFGTKSQSLESSFPTRLIEQMGKNGVSEEQLKERLTRIDQKRQRFMTVGILPREQKRLDVPTDGVSENTREVLAVYATDTEAKLSILEETAAKLEILLEIINRRFRYKQLQITDAGYHVVDHKGQPIPLTALSSGEQHQLVVLYELLFGRARGSLVLIDEPELSLHVAWAKYFIRDLQKITELVGIDALVATHSPDLIADHWDLTVELKGPELP